MELSPFTAARWLADKAIDPSKMQFRELGGGVSNRVILADSPGWRAVLKQPLGRLRVEQEWLSDRTRIFREAAAMRWAKGKLRGGRVPELLIEDPDEFIIAMEAAPADAVMWKELLFAGVFDPEHARAVGWMLGSMIATSFASSEARSIFEDRTVFRQLRIDPYYRFTAERHPKLAPFFHGLIERSAARAVSLVHGDWSPKNLLVSGQEVWVIDWEVVHFGDPSFDVGFLLNHLLLKSIAMPQYREPLAHLAETFVTALRTELPPEGLWVEGAAFEHLPALLLARVDGKSPAEYLTEEMRGNARHLAISLMNEGARPLKELFEA